MIYRPIPIDREITFSQKKFIVSKTDLKGKILFVNKNLCDISGYTEEELIGTSHNILRHPDMPRAIFFLIWSNLLRGEPVSGVVKNLAKSGEYYWVIADFDVKKDPQGHIKSFTAFRRAAPQQVIDEVEELYDSMLKVEKKHGIEGSLSYFEAYLNERGMNYDEFLTDLVAPKGLMAKFFSAFKGLLGQETEH
ncbi:MAG: PAS domain-containing protein [Campylobacterales bacterium]|nr:PAS domain-containing protein [Campylobacterales bacterium]